MPVENENERSPQNIDQAQEMGGEGGLQADDTAPAPIRTGGPGDGWPHRKLYERVIDALHTLPARFKSPLVISGVRVTDLFTLNTALGAGIEDAVVSNLNLLRELWDPDDQYANYVFVRQAQVFPDVRLQTNAPSIPHADRVLMGIELKGWFMLAKEKEPSFRYRVAPGVCAPQDLLVIYPWILSEVVSGTPKLHMPLIDEARFAAEHRNYYWQHMRRDRKTGQILEGRAIDIRPAEVNQPYPAKGERFNEAAVEDAGSNFGRVARGRYMEPFIEKLNQTEISGIQVQYWQRFLSIFVEGIDNDNVGRALEKMLSDARNDGVIIQSEAALERVFEAIVEYSNTQA